MHAWLPPGRPDPRTREELQSLLEASSPTAESAMLIEQTARKGGSPLYASLLGLLLPIELPEDEAARHWKSLWVHREDLAARLGRDPGLRVAALDYFLHRERLLVRPVFLDGGAERLLGSAWRDSLTGLATYRHFQALLKRELRRAGRGSREFSVVLVEQDAPPRPGARGGREREAALREMASILQARLRDADMAARAGGTGFALLLPETGRLGAYVVARRILRAAEERFRQPGRAGRCLLLTLSAGAAVYPADGESGEQLLERASQALGRARLQGGNRPVLHHREMREGMRFRPLGGFLRVRATPGGGEDSRILKAIDFSGTGALLESEAPFEIGEELELRVPDPSPGPELVLPARVERQWPVPCANCPGGFRVGVRFLAERPACREALAGLLSGLESRGIEQGGS